MGPIIFAIVFVGAIVIIFKIFEARKNRAEREATHKQLVAQYGEELAGKIMSGEVWQGATEQQVELALGAPAATEETVLKTKTKRTWKYAQTGANRFAMRVFFEDGECVGWERK